MDTAFFWVFLTLGFTAIMWIPYIYNVIRLMGFRAFGYAPRPELAPWAQRAQAAHKNAVENLVIFLPAVIIYYSLTKESTGMLNILCLSYFIARVVHYFSTLFKVPLVRTLAFAFAWLVQICLIWHIGVLACVQQT